LEKVKLLTLVVAVLCCRPQTCVAQDASPDVPLSHPVYDLLDRCDARGWFSAALPGIRPYSRIFVAGLLRELHADGGGRLNDAGLSEQGVYSRYRFEFAPELGRLAAAVKPEQEGLWNRLRRGGSLASWDARDTYGAVDGLFSQRISKVGGTARRNETVSHTYVGGSVHGVYKTRVGFRARHFEAREWGSRARLVRSDVMARPIEKVQLKGKTVDFREAAFQVVVATDWFVADVGKGLMDWGPAPGSNLLLSAGTTPYAYARVRTSVGRVRFVHTVGFLEPRPGVIDSAKTRIDNGHVRTFPRRKHLGAHRIEITLPRRLVLGLQESVVYGDRPPELLYVTPVTVLAASQSYLGDTDNLLLGLDLTARPARNLRVLAALLFDDMVKFSPGDFANKFGLQLGALWVDPFGWTDTDLRTDFVRIEPYVYSHNYAINTYEHFDSLLGCSIGPNADRFRAQIDHRFTPALSASVAFARQRNGENPVADDGSIHNIGGDAALGRRPDDARSRDFMAGDVETTRSVRLELEYEPVRDLRFRASLSRASATNVLLPTGTRGDGHSSLWRVGTEYHFH
jgi:hypothetical protein